MTEMTKKEVWNDGLLALREISALKVVGERDNAMARNMPGMEY